jgi:hypothetical protein
MRLILHLTMIVIKRKGYNVTKICKMESFNQGQTNAHDTGTYGFSTGRSLFVSRLVSLWCTSSERSLGERMDSEPLTQTRALSPLGLSTWTYGTLLDMLTISDERFPLLRLLLVSYEARISALKVVAGPSHFLSFFSPHLLLQCL